MTIDTESMRMYSLGKISFPVVVWAEVSRVRERMGLTQRWSLSGDARRPGFPARVAT